MAHICRSRNGLIKAVSDSSSIFGVSNAAIPPVLGDARAAVGNADVNNMEITY